MSQKILNKSLVRPFYRQNAGQFLFIFIVFFGVVAPSQQLHYHHDLIEGMLNTPLLFGLVFLAWFIYHEKCAGFVLSALQSPEYSFLDVLNRLGSQRLYIGFLSVQSLLFLPVSLYAIAVIGVACDDRRWLSALCVAAYILLLSGLNAARFLYQCRHPGVRGLFVFRLAVRYNTPGGYWSFFIRYALLEQKLLVAGIKLFCCAVLYFGVKSMAADEYDLRMSSLFFGIGLFGHGVLVYRFRELEERRLLFYKGLPVSLSVRFMHYVILYGVVLVPEIITLGWLVRGHLHYKDALDLFFSAYGFLLLLNSLLFVAPIPIREYLKIVFCLFLLLYFCVLAGILAWLAAATLLIASVLFLGQYYRFESSAEGF